MIAIDVTKSNDLVFKVIGDSGLETDIAVSLNNTDRQGLSSTLTDALNIAFLYVAM